MASEQKEGRYFFKTSVNIIQYIIIASTCQAHLAANTAVPMSFSLKSYALEGRTLEDCTVHARSSPGPPSSAPFLPVLDHQEWLDI
jgi:hypothetical protein